MVNFNNDSLVHPDPLAYCALPIAMVVYTYKLGLNCDPLNIGELGMAWHGLARPGTAWHC
jgi:hypothetical protein